TRFARGRRLAVIETIREFGAKASLQGAAIGCQGFRTPLGFGSFVEVLAAKRLALIHVAGRGRVPDMVFRVRRVLGTFKQGVAFELLLNERGQFKIAKA